MNQPDLMTEIAEIITDMRRIEYNLDDPMRHCKSEAKRLAAKILADAAQQARGALLIVNLIEHDQRCNEREVKP